MRREFTEEEQAVIVAWLAVNSPTRVAVKDLREVEKELIKGTSRMVDGDE